MQNEHNGFHVLINSRSGTALKLGIEGIKAAIQESGLNVAELHLPEGGEEFGAVIERLATQDAPVIIGGGDGTIMQSAPVFRKNNKPFGFLPMGTMNLLAADLGLPFALPECLNAYAQGTETVSIDVAEVNGTAFLCCAGIGVMPEASSLREEHRDEPSLLLVPRLTMFVLGQLDKARRRTFHVRVNGGRRKRVRTNAIVVSNNPFDMAVSDNFKRKSLNHGIMGLYIATPRRLWDRIRFLFRLHIGGWERDPVIRQQVAETIEIQSKRRKETVSLDGENVTLRMPLHFTMHRDALQILIPSGVKDEATS